MRRLKRWGYYIPAYRYTHRSLMKAFYFHEVFGEIKNVDGDVVECGVGYGNSIVILGSLVDLNKKERRVIGFDSFEGFPDTNEDWSRAAHFKGANVKRVEKRIESAKLPIKIKLIKGFLRIPLNHIMEK